MLHVSQLNTGLPNALAHDYSILRGSEGIVAIITCIFPLPDSSLGAGYQSSQQTFLFDLYHTDQNAHKLLGVLSLYAL